IPPGTQGADCRPPRPGSLRLAQAIRRGLLDSHQQHPPIITFCMEPGRSGVVRQPGTNIWTGAGTSQGTPLNVTISSTEAINVPPIMRAYMNFRQTDQRGVIYPVPTTPNTNVNNVGGNAGGNEGLQDLLLDEARGRL